MTENGGRDRLRAAPRASGAQRAVGSFDRYGEAEKAVDYLSDRRFPVDRTTIVASDLRAVEQATGRVGYARATLDGGATGAVIGMLFGFVAGIFNWIDPIVSGLALGLYGLVFGAVTGVIAGLALHALTRGRRGFTSIGHVEASRYDVLVDEDWAHEAARLLEDGGLATRRAAPARTDLPPVA